MILITQNEAMYLAKKGCKWQTDLHHTYSGHKKYYMTESPRLMKMLNTYRDKHTVESRS